MLGLVKFFILAHLDFGFGNAVVWGLLTGKPSQRLHPALIQKCTHASECYENLHVTLK